MSHAAITAAIVATLGNVQGLGTVHGFERFSARERDFRAFYLQEDDDALLGWYVSRKSWTAVARDSASEAISTRWVIQGYLSLNDEQQSENTAQRLIDAIARAFRRDETLGGVVESTTSPTAAGIQLDDFQPVMFAGVLCHSIRLSLVTLHAEDSWGDDSADGLFETGHVDWDPPARDIVKPEQ